MDRKYKGYLISYEGGDGAGKTFQIPPITEWIRETLHLSVFPIREPGTTDIGLRVRAILMDLKVANMDDRTELLLFEAARAQMVQEVLIPHLELGEICLLDRYADSSAAYQGVGRGLGMEAVNFINKFATQGYIPDLTILFDVDHEIGIKRRYKEGVNRIDAAPLDFHKKVRGAFLEMAKSDTSGRWEIIDASKTPGEVTEDLKRIIEGRLINVGMLEGRYTQKEFGL